MTKKLSKLFSFIFLFSVLGCNNDVSSNISNSLTPDFTPTGDLERIFYELKDNNFTVEYSDKFINNNNVIRNAKFYYTDYSLQSEGDFGFAGIAQGDELIFKYSLEDGEVVAGAPLISSNYGTRYENIFDYTYGMNGFDFSALPDTMDSNGYYNYTWGENIVNDKIFMPIFLRLSPVSLPPISTKIKVVKDVIIMESVILTYDFDGDGIDEVIDTISTTIYDIGKTENPEIKKYLNDGKTSKNPLDLRFYKLFHPYLFTENYTVDLDASEMLSSEYKSFKMTEYCTKDAILDVQGTNKSGYMLNQGIVTNYTIKNEKVNITYTPKNEDGDFYYYLYGDILAYPFSSLDYNTLLGYKDDVNDNVYYLTDSYLIYVLSYICYNEVYEANYCDKVKLEIINDETNEFKLYFDMYNKTTNRKLGVYKAHFYDLNNTTIPAVNEYLSLGDDAYSQTKDNLANVLNKFKNHNYSLDSVTGMGMAKYYYTTNYMYCEIYGSPNNNFGFIKVNDSIYEFLIKDGQVILDQSKDFAANGFDLPGLAEYFGHQYDFGYISTIGDALYNVENYSQATSYDQTYWRLDNSKSNGLSNAIFDYYFASPEDILPTGTGIVIKDANENSKLSIYLSYISSDGEYQGYTYLTYYDIGTTSHAILDNYLNNI